MHILSLLRSSITNPIFYKYFVGAIRTFTVQYRPRGIIPLLSLQWRPGRKKIECENQTYKRSFACTSQNNIRSICFYFSRQKHAPSPLSGKQALDENS